MSTKIKKLIGNVAQVLDNNDTSAKEDFQKIIQYYEDKFKRSNRIMEQSDKQQLLMLKLKEELEDHKKNLELKVEKEIKKREEKERMLLQQTKLASMGEMMDAVAHQWKQPLNVISAQVITLSMQSQLGMLNDKSISKFEKDITNQVTHMTNTLNEFRTFFRPAKNTIDFDIEKMIKKALLLVKDEFIKYNIKLTVNSISNFKLNGIENEFKHLVLNIINNAKDAFVEKSTKDRNIVINILSDNEYETIEIIDNAGGIPEDIIGDIFKANVTTKEDGKGTGIGLYMSSQIAQKHHGELSAKNIDGGAKFLFKHKKI